MVRRISLLIAAALLLGAVLVTFLPTSPHGDSCGSWFNPTWTQAHTNKILKEARRLYTMGNALATATNGGEGAGDMATAVSAAKEANDSYQACGSALSGRRTWAVVLLVFTGVAPGALLWVDSARRRERTQPAT